MRKLKVCISAIILSIGVFLLSNCARKNSSTQLVENYYHKLNQSNYLALSEFIGDSITISEGDYDMKYSKDDYYTFFQWDSVFSPKYKVLEIKEIDNKLAVSVSKTCTRIQFLNQKPIISKEIIDLDQKQSSRIRWLYVRSDKDRCPKLYESDGVIYRI